MGGGFLLCISNIRGHAKQLSLFHDGHALHMLQEFFLALFDSLAINRNCSIRLFNLLSCSWWRLLTFSLRHIMIHQDVHNCLPGGKLTNFFFPLLLLSGQSLLNARILPFFDHLYLEQARQSLPPCIANWLRPSIKAPVFRIAPPASLRFWLGWQISSCGSLQVCLVSRL